MIQVIDNEIKQYRLPKTGTLSTGETVSNYDLLPIKTLMNEGWLPLEDLKPIYDDKTQYLALNRYEILGDKVIKHYDIKEIKENIFEKVTRETTENKAIINTLLGVE